MAITATQAQALSQPQSNSGNRKPASGEDRGFGRAFAAFLGLPPSPISPPDRPSAASPPVQQNPLPAEAQSKVPRKGQGRRQNVLTSGRGTAGGTFGVPNIARPRAGGSALLGG